MNEILIFSGIGSVIYIFVKNKLTKYKDEIIELRKKLPQEFTAEQKLNMKKAGDDFEKYVGKYFEDDGYEVEYRGINLGFLDGGIDLIAKKNNKIFLIQCKYWKKKDSITHNMVKEFYGNCNFYIDNNKLNRENITCIYAVAKRDAISFQAYDIFKLNYINCRYQLFEC